MPSTKKNLRYRLDPGLQETLELLVENKLDPHVEEWRKQVADGVIDGETREVFVAVGWVTYRDSRLEHVTAQPRRKAKVEAIADRLDAGDPDAKEAQEMGG